MLIIPMNAPKKTGLEFALIDDADYPQICRYYWWVRNGSADPRDNRYRYVYGRLRKECRTVESDARVVSLHRLLLGVSDKDILVDHINGNTLDNRRCNLREANGSINQLNRHRKLPNRLSKYMGVSKIRGGDGTRVWRAQIKVNYKNVHLGSFHTEEEASRAYQLAKSTLRY